MDDKRLERRGPATWVPRERLVAVLVQADPGLRRDLDEALSDTIEDLDSRLGLGGSPPAGR